MRDPLAVLDVIAEPTRRKILDAVREAERSVSQIVEAVGMRQPGVSRHLKVLRDAENTGRMAGALLGAARSTSTIDALVVASVIEVGGGVVLTGDRNDLAPLASGHPAVVIRPL